MSQAPGQRGRGGGAEELASLASIGLHGKTPGMANRPVNDKQRRVLDWLSTGATQDPPEPDMKLSAAALKSRGLVKVRRLQGKWTCELTDLGRYYVEHGAYPPEPEEPAKEPATRSGRTAKKPKEKAPKVSVPPSLTDEESSIRITKPHPAVRSLMDRPMALGTDHDTRRRGFVAAHMLLRAAADAGFEIEGHVQPKKRSNDTPYRGEPLVTLDAGHQKVIVNIGESMRRTPTSRPRRTRSGATRGRGATTTCRATSSASVSTEPMSTAGTASSSPRPAASR